MKDTVLCGTASSPQKAISLFDKTLSFISILDRIKTSTPQSGESVNNCKAALSNNHFSKKCMMEMKGIKDKKLNI
jgi:hypothetical protein